MAFVDVLNMQCGQSVCSIHSVRASETCFSSGLLIISYGMLLNIHPDLRQAIKLVSDSAVQRRVDVNAREKK